MMPVIVLTIFSVVALSLAADENLSGSIMGRPDNVGRLQSQQCTSDTGNDLANHFCEISTQLQAGSAARKNLENCVKKDISAQAKDCVSSSDDLNDLTGSLCQKDSSKDMQTQKMLCCYGEKVDKSNGKAETLKRLKGCSTTMFSQ